VAPAREAAALSGFKLVRQEPVGPYFADFACREQRLIVEIDGATHSTDTELRHDLARARLSGHETMNTTESNGVGNGIELRQQWVFQQPAKLYGSCVHMRPGRIWLG
jgi:hypothetical protein